MCGSAIKVLEPVLAVLAVLALLLPSSGAAADICEVDSPAQSCCCEAEGMAPDDEGRPSQAGHEDCTPLCRALCGHTLAFVPPPAAGLASISVVNAHLPPPVHPVIVEGPGCLFRPPRLVF